MTKPTADPYAVLGVGRDADERTMRDAYRRLAKRYHPDLHPDARTSEHMRRVNEAWDVLSDPVRRARYDADHPSTRSARPWTPAWAPAPARATTSDRQAASWGASAWTSRPRHEPRSRAEGPRLSGPPWAAILAILVVGWLVVAVSTGGFPVPLVLGSLVVAGVGSLLSRWE